MSEILHGSVSWHRDVVNLRRRLREVRADTCCPEAGIKFPKLGGITQIAMAHRS